MQQNKRGVSVCEESYQRDQSDGRSERVGVFLNHCFKKGKKVKLLV